MGNLLHIIPDALGEMYSVFIIPIHLAKVKADLRWKNNSAIWPKNAADIGKISQ